MGQIAVVVQDQVQFHRPFAPLVLRPVEHGQAHSDGSRVDRQQLRLEPELALLFRRFALAVLQQLAKHRSTQIPGTMLVGVCQGRSLGGLAHAQVPQLPLAGGQPTGDLAQALGVAQWAEQHREELRPTAEPARMTPGFMFPDLGLKLQAGDELQNLAENTAYSIHGGSLRAVEVWFLMRTQIETTAASALPAQPLRPDGRKPNLGKSVSRYMPLRAFSMAASPISEAKIWTGKLHLFPSGTPVTIWRSSKPPLPWHILAPRSGSPRLRADSERSQGRRAWSTIVGHFRSGQTGK